MRAIDDRNRCTPIALATDTPVTNTELGLFFTQALGLKSISDFVNALVNGQAIKLAGDNQLSGITLVGVPFFPSVRTVSLAGHADNLLNRQVVFFSKSKITFIMSRNAHNGAFAVAH